MVFTGWGCVASSCFIKIRPFHPRCDEDPTLLIATSRDGIMSVMDPAEVTHPYAGMAYSGVGSRDQDHDPRAGWRTKIETALHREPKRLLKRLSALWTNPPAKMARHPLYHASRDNVLRPRGREAPELTLGTPYEIQMDWAFPYALKDDGTGGVPVPQRIFPFNLETSYVHGHPLVVPTADHWNPTLIVRFSKVARAGTARNAGDRHYDYITEVLTRDLTVIYPFAAPARGSDPLTALSFRGRARAGRLANTSPRLSIPIFEGFLLLHKMWLLTVEGNIRNEMHTIAEASITRDRAKIEALALTFSCIHDNISVHRTGPEACDRLREVSDTASANLARQHSVSDSPTFRALFDAYMGRGHHGIKLRDIEARYWYRFPHFLGPLTFLWLGMYVLSESPIASQVSDAIGSYALRPPNLPGAPVAAWESDHSEGDDVMLVDKRFIDVSNPPMLAEDPIGWSKRSVSIAGLMGRVWLRERMKGYWHPDALRFIQYGPSGFNNPANAPRAGSRALSLDDSLTLGKLRVDVGNAAQFSAWLGRKPIDLPWVGDSDEFVKLMMTRQHEGTALHAAQKSFCHFMGFTFTGTPDPVAVMTQHLQNAYVAERDRHTRLPGGHGTFPLLIDTLDGIRSLLVLMGTCSTLLSQDRVEPSHVVHALSDVVGFSASSANLAVYQMERIGTGSFLRRLNFAANALSIGADSYDALDQFGRGNGVTGGLRTLQAACGVATMFGMGAAGTGVGALVVVGSLVVYSVVEVVILYRQARIPSFRHLVARWVADLQEAAILNEIDSLHIRVGAGDHMSPHYVAILEEYRRRKIHVIENRSLMFMGRLHRSQMVGNPIRTTQTLKTIWDCDDAWDNFNRSQWRTLMDGLRV